MLDGLLGRNFSAKCKASIKVTRTRIEVIRRKRNATQKFLKKDVADLLANGLDINAYGRAEGLIAELTLSACYDFIEQSCECVLKHLSVMQKQSECPEESRTAVASLMLAAARFSDLPELRDLRHVFQERYGNSLEYFVNQKFVENSASNPSTMEKKIQLMQSIASEYSISWDSRAFERTMPKPPVFAQDQLKQYKPSHVIENRYKSPNGSNTGPKEDKIGASPKERHEPTSNGLRSHNKEDRVTKREEMSNRIFGRQDVTGNGEMPLNGREANIPKRDELKKLFQQRHEFITGKHEMMTAKDDTSKLHKVGISSHDKRLHNGRDGDVPKNDVCGALSPGKHEFNLHNGQKIKGDARVNPFAGRNMQDGGKFVTGKLELLDTTPTTLVLGSSSRGKQPELTDDKYRLQNAGEDAIPKKDKHDILSPGKQELAIRNELVKGDYRDIPLAGRNNQASHHQISNSTQKIQAEEMDGLKRYNNAIPPPYLKPPKASKHGNSLRSIDADLDGAYPKRDLAYPSGEKSEINQVVYDHSDEEKQNVGPVRLSSHTRNKEQKYHDDIITGDILPKPRSVRRRHPKPSSSHADTYNPEDRKPGKRASSGRRKGDPRQGLQLVIDDDQFCKDDEERIMDKLLLHYSKKPSAYDPEKLRRKSRARPSDNGSNDEQLHLPGPARSVSLPHDQTGPSEGTKVFARAASFQTDRSQHVHPKLPDYDDLAARFAALKGR